MYFLLGMGSGLGFFVCCHPIYSGRQTTPFGIIYGRIISRGRTTRERPHRSVFLLPSAVLALIFYREKGSAVPFSRRP